MEEEHSSGREDFFSKTGFWAQECLSHRCRPTFFMFFKAPDLEEHFSYHHTVKPGRKHESPNVLSFRCSGAS